MNNKQLQTKRQPKKSGFRKLNAKVSRSRRKQRVSAAASAGELDSNVPNPSISRSLTIIFVLHVVAIVAVSIGVQWNKGRQLPAESAIATPKAVDLTGVNGTLETAFVMHGDSYASFAARHRVDEAELRRVNANVELKADTPLFLPPQKIVVQPQSTAPQAVSDRPPLPTTDEVVHLEVARAVVVEPAPAVATASGTTYKVKSGDTIWGIKKKHNVDQKALMELNNLKSARDLKAGMVLQIPAQ